MAVARLCERFERHGGLGARRVRRQGRGTGERGATAFILSLLYTPKREKGRVATLPRCLLLLRAVAVALVFKKERFVAFFSFLVVEFMFLKC